MIIFLEFFVIRMVLLIMNKSIFFFILQDFNQIEFILDKLFINCFR